jgi:Protein of unknown function (DUF1376)
MLFVVALGKARLCRPKRRFVTSLPSFHITTNRDGGYMYYYQHHIGDYRKDTSHLSLIEHGIYRQLLDLYYITEKPLDKKSIRLID